MQLLNSKPITYNYIKSTDELKEAAKDIELYKRITRDKNKRPRFGFDLETYPCIDGIEDMTAKELEKVCEELKIRDYRPIKNPMSEYGYEARSRLFQLGLDPQIQDLQFLFDVRELGEDQLAFYHKDSIENCLLIGHYLIYDTEYLVSDQYNLFPQFLRCTCLGPQLWLAGDSIDLDNPDPRKKQRYALYACYQKFLDWGWFKSYTGRDINEYVDFKLKNQTSNWGAKVLTLDQLEYASDDVRLVQWLYKAEMQYLDTIIKDYNKPGLTETYKLECQAIVPFAIMGVVGTQVDTDQLDKVVKDFEDEIEKGKNELSRYPEFWREMSETRGRGANKVTRTWCEFINLNSKPGRGKKDPETGEKPKTMGQLLDSLAKFGLKLTSTGREFLEELVYDPESTISEEHREILLKILAYKVPAYMNTKYGKNLYREIHADGRFHCRYFQIGGRESESGLDGGVDTQRTTAAYPPVQTFPSDKKTGQKVRKMITATAGNTFLVFDFNNQEVQIAYMLTKDPYLYKVFKEKRDQHSETAKFVLDLDYLPEKGTDERQVGKTAYLAHQYQQGYKMFSKKVYEATMCQKRLSMEESKLIKERLKEQYPGITNKINLCNSRIKRHLEDYSTLRSFQNRKPIFMGFTEMDYVFKDTGEKFKFTRLRGWYLKLEQEKMAKLKIKDHTEDPLSRNYQKWNEEKGVFETWNNEFNSRESEIRREYFNFLIQPEGATMLKLAMRDVYEAFKRLYYDTGKYTIYQLAIVLECHDELVIDCPEEIKYEVAELVEKIMTRIFRAIVRGLDDTTFAKPATTLEILKDNTVTYRFHDSKDANKKLEELGEGYTMREVPGVLNWAEGK